jgi:hypothetical protein
MAKPKLIVRMTQKQAEKLGIVFCKCGHWPTQHFKDGTGACAHCGCTRYRQVIRLPS